MMVSIVCRTESWDSNLHLNCVVRFLDVDVSESIYYQIYVWLGHGSETTAQILRQYTYSEPESDGLHTHLNGL